MDLTTAYIAVGSGLTLYYMGKEIFKFGGSQTPDDRLRHSITTGQTGTGKSVYCRNNILEAIKYGGVLFIDQHGHDSEELLNEIPDKDKDRVIYINPADLQMPIGINFYADKKSELQNELSVNQIISTFTDLWGSSIGPSTEDLIRMSGLSVVEQEISTLLETYMMLSKEEYRSSIEVKNEVAKDFWNNIFPDMPSNALNPPLNKFRALVAPTIHRLVFCQSKPKLDLLEAMNNGSIIVCNFAQRLGDKTSQLLSSIMVSKIQLLGFTRNENSVPFELHLDEYQNYVTRSFAKMLSEARKFNLGMHLYNQYNSQVPDYLLAAIAGNCGSRYCFRIGELDAPYLSQFLNPFTPKDLTSLPNYQYVAKRLVKGVKDSEAAKYRANKPPKKYGNAEYIKQRSRELYGIPRHIIEQDISNRLNIKINYCNVGDF